MKSIIENIELKVVQLIEQCDQLRSKNSILKTDNDALNAKLQDKEEELVALHDKVKLMSISKSISFSKQELKDTRLEINKYIREIDKCIALLNK